MSEIVRVNYRRGQKETEKIILTADNTSMRYAEDGTLIVELFRYDERNGEPLEGYQFRFDPEDIPRFANITERSFK